MSKAWHNKTPEEILQDMSDAVGYIVQQSKEAVEWENKVAEFQGKLLYETMLPARKRENYVENIKSKRYKNSKFAMKIARKRFPAMSKERDLQFRNAILSFTYEVPELEL